MENLMNHSEEEEEPFSTTRKQLIILGFFPLSEAIAWTTIFPYIYSMVHSFSSLSVSGDQSAAVYAGIMVSVFTLGEFIMAPQWARISDRIGRKPTLLIGSLGAMLSTLMFGFSNSLPMAVVARTTAGLLNPNLGVVKTFVGELVGKDQQAKGFSVVPFLRGFGTIIGPVIGGYLAEPVQKYPSVFLPHTIWEKFPYLLPNIVVTFCLMISCVLAFLWLREVHPHFRGQADIGRRLGTGIENLLTRKAWSDGRGTYTSVRSREEGTELASAGDGTGNRSESRSLENLDRRSAFTQQVILQIISFAILGYLKIAMVATIPIFLGTPQQTSNSKASGDLDAPKSKIHGNAGFGLSTQGISNVLLTQAVAAIVSQILIVPRIIDMQGPLSSYRLAIFVLICLYFTIPLATGLPKWEAVGLIAILLWIYALVNGLGTTCSAILTTNTAPSPVYLATINGTAASLGCLARTLGPAVSGPLFRLGLKTGHVGLPFWALGAVGGMGMVLSYFLRDHP